VSALSEAPFEDVPLFDPAAPLSPSGNLRRRAAISDLIGVGARLAAFIAVAMLVLVVLGVVQRGASVLSFSFITTNPVGLAGGGIANALIGTFLLVGAAAVIAVPIGVLTGLYLTEYAGAQSRSGRALRLALDVMQGLPTVVVGLFVYGLIVIPERKASGFAGAVALSIVMLPLVARASQEVLLLVPGSLREAADALGVSRWRTVLTVILPVATGGIATGALLAIARAAGETAPLLICDGIFNPNATELMIFGHGVPNIPLLIYTSSEVGIAGGFARAWGAAIVLLGAILIVNVGARVLLARSRARMGL
jgi:phosphate transport system permease protein